MKKFMVTFAAVAILAAAGAGIATTKQAYTLVNENSKVAEIPVGGASVEPVVADTDSETFTTYSIPVGGA